MISTVDTVAKADTKSRILDTAEKLFALNGFQETSLRDITRAADVNLAAVNYHFQSKDSLMDAVIARRIEPLNRTRIAMLDAAGPNPTVPQILTAFLNPIVDAPVEVLAPLIGRVLSNPEMFIDRIFNKHFAPIVHRFVDAFEMALPELGRTEILWRLQYSVGVMTHLLLWGQKIPIVTNGLCQLTDRPALLKQTVEFLVAGFESKPSIHKPSIQKTEQQR